MWSKLLRLVCVLVIGLHSGLYTTAHAANHSLDSDGSNYHSTESGLVPIKQSDGFDTPRQSYFTEYSNREQIIDALGHLANAITFKFEQDSRTLASMIALGRHVQTYQEVKDKLTIPFDIINFYGNLLPDASNATLSDDFDKIFGFLGIVSKIVPDDHRRHFTEEYARMLDEADRQYGPLLYNPRRFDISDYENFIYSQLYAGDYFDEIPIYYIFESFDSPSKQLVTPNASVIALLMQIKVAIASLPDPLPPTVNVEKLIKNIERLTQSLRLSTIKSLEFQLQSRGTQSVNSDKRYRLGNLSGITDQYHKLIEAAWNDQQVDYEITKQEIAEASARGIVVSIGFYFGGLEGASKSNALVNRISFISENIAKPGQILDFSKKILGLDAVSIVGEQYASATLLYKYELTETYDVVMALLRQIVTEAVTPSTSLPSEHLAETLSISSSTNIETYEILFSPTNFLLSVCTSNGLYVFDLRTGNVVSTLHYGSKVWQAAYSADGSILATVTGQEDIQLWRTDTYQMIKTLPRTHDNVPDATEGPGTKLAFSPDGRVLASTYFGTIYLWDTMNWNRSKSIAAHNHWISHIAFNDSSSLLASSSYDSSVAIWDVDSGKLFRRHHIDSDIGGFTDVEFAENGAVYIAARNTDSLINSDSKGLIFWQTENGGITYSFTVDDNDIPIFALSTSDHELAFSKGDDSVISLFDSETWMPLGTLEPKGNVQSLAFHPNKNLLAANFILSPTIQLWDLDRVLYAGDRVGSTTVITNSNTITDSPLASPENTGAPVTSSIAISQTTDTIVETATQLHAVVRVNSLNVRAGDGTGFRVIGQVNSGSELDVKGRNLGGTWLFVCCVNDSDGWISNNSNFIQVTGDINDIPVTSASSHSDQSTTQSSSKCSIPIFGRFVTVYRKTYPGCPSTPGVTTNMAFQLFEHGAMYWVPDTPHGLGGDIYVLYPTHEWTKFRDTWNSEMPLSGGLVAPSGLVEPVQGFGLIWRELLGGPSSNLGWALQSENSIDPCWIQKFDEGSIALRCTNQPTYWLMSDTTWTQSG